MMILDLSPQFEKFFNNGRPDIIIGGGKATFNETIKLLYYEYPKEFMHFMNRHLRIYNVDNFKAIINNIDNNFPKVGFEYARLSQQRKDFFVKLIDARINLIKNNSMAKYEFNSITLMWRPGKGSRRIAIGSLSKDKVNGALKFEYSQNGIDEAKKVDSHFVGYPGLPIDSLNFESSLLEEIFFSRLINTERNDARQLLDFWLVDPLRYSDKYYLLAQTQGLSFSDTFEFVPRYFKSHKNSFITDIAGLSRIPYDLSKLHIGDKLQFVLEPENEYDPNAVYVSHNMEKIGYIKQGHNTVFNRTNLLRIKLTVWSIVSIGDINKLYVRVDIPR